MWLFSRGWECLSAKMLATAAAATVAAVTILPTVMGSPVEVRFEYLNATDTVLEYVLSSVAGTVTGLNAGARYDVVVKSGGSTVTSRSVTMATKRTTELRSVYSQCKCAVDGTFHFRVNFIDENGYWSDFHATLTDEFGNTSECDFSDAPTEEHTLAVQSADMRGNRAVLRIPCTTTLAKCIVGVEYGDSLERIELIIRDNLEAIRKNISSIVEGPYYKGVDALNSSSVDLLFVAYCKEEDIFQVQRDMNREIKLVFDKNNINIPFPQVTVSELKENDIVVSKHIEKASREFHEEQKALSKGMEDDK